MLRDLVVGHLLGHSSSLLLQHLCKETAATRQPGTLSGLHARLPMAALMTFRSGNRRPAVWIDGVRGAWRYRPCYVFEGETAWTTTSAFGDFSSKRADQLPRT